MYLSHRVAVIFALKDDPPGSPILMWQTIAPVFAKPKPSVNTGAEQEGQHDTRTGLDGTHESITVRPEVKVFLGSQGTGACRK